MWCCCWIRRMTSTTCALAPVGSFCFVFLLSATFNAEVSYPKLVRICLTSFVVQFKVSQPMEVCAEKGHTITHEFLLWWCCLTFLLLMVDDGIVVVVNHPFIPFWTVLQQARSKFGACLFSSNLFFIGLNRHPFCCSSFSRSQSSFLTSISMFCTASFGSWTTTTISTFPKRCPSASLAFTVPGDSYYSLGLCVNRVLCNF